MNHYAGYDDPYHHDLEHGGIFPTLDGMRPGAFARRDTRVVHETMRPGPAGYVYTLIVRTQGLTLRVRVDRAATIDASRAHVHVLSYLRTWTPLADAGTDWWLQTPPPKVCRTDLVPVAVRSVAHGLLDTAVQIVPDQDQKG